MCTPVEVLRRVETLDELLGLRRPRGALCGEGLAAEDLGVVDAQLRGEDLVAQPGLGAGVVVPCLHRRGFPPLQSALVAFLGGIRGCAHQLCHRVVDVGPVEEVVCNGIS